MVKLLNIINHEKYMGYDQFAKIYHDIQSPLRNIANFLQLIKIQLMAGQTAQVYEYIDFAIDNINALNELNKSLLVNDGDRNLKIDIRNVIKNVANLLKDQIGNSNCKINFDKQIPAISGCYIDVFRLFKNLIENSLLHAKTDALLITIKTISKTNTTISIIFEDNGKDLSPDKKNSIDHTLTNTCNENDYLGLAICRDIMAGLNGSIRIIKERPSCSYELIFKLFIEG